MAPNHGGRRVLGLWVNALVACAVVAMTGFVTGAAANGALGGTATPLQAQIMLTSLGTGNAPATAPNARPAISENGRYVAFQSQATLNTSASVIPPSTQLTTPSSPNIVPPSCCNDAKPAAQAPANFRIYARDQTGNVTSLLSNPNLGSAAAPTISGTGKLVSYLLNDGFENNVLVVNRQATGAGPFDTTANLAVKQVTGTPNDLQFERIPVCPTGISAPKPAIRTTPCGPKLSADGSTLVYPAQQSPVSPSLNISATIFETQVSVTGNVIDDDVAGPGESFSSTITYTVTGNQPVTITGLTTTGPFETNPDDPTACVGTFQPGKSCQVTLFNSGAACPTTSTTTVTGTLQTDSAVPDGQSSVALVLFCNDTFGGDSGTEGTAKLSHPPAHLLAAAGCAVPPGLPVVQAPAAAPDNDNNPLIDLDNLGPNVIGQPYVAIVNFSVANQFPVQFVSPDCGLQNVTPASLGLPGGQQLVSCTETDGGQDCTAYVVVTPGTLSTTGTVGTDVASFIGVNSDAAREDTVDTYLSVTGLSDIVIARHDKTGAGNFAASPSTVVSVDSKGHMIPDASEPSVSATGRYVAFTASAPTSGSADLTGVWRHDTDAAGNGTGPPATMLVSCVGALEGACVPGGEADSPSISGDGSQVAFATNGDIGQVFVWNVQTSTSTLVSSPASAPPGSGAQGNGPSYAPAISQDGSTVAYISRATDLAATLTTPGATNLFARNLNPGAPAVNELVSSTGASLPQGDDIALPDVDARGGLITFQTSQHLLSQAPPAPVTSVYTFEREPVLAFSPAPVNFGTMKVGTKPATLTVTVTDIGPGPGTVTSGGTTGPFGITVGACAGAVLHDGDSCVVTVTFVPLHSGTDTGSLTSTITDELGSPHPFSVPVTATVTTQAEHARISVNPGVAPAGQVTDVTGSGFIPGQRVILSWDPGLGQQQVTAKSNDGITAVMVIFPDDFTGVRVLEARDLSGQLLATVNFLVQQPTPEPPGAPFGSGSGQGLVIAPG